MIFATALYVASPNTKGINFNGFKYGSLPLDRIQTFRPFNLTPLSMDLYWLSVEQRIDFKLLLNTCKILHDQSVNYLKPLMKEYRSSHHLWSTSGSSLSCQMVEIYSYGTSLFFCSFILKTRCNFNQFKTNCKIDKNAFGNALPGRASWSKLNFSRNIHFWVLQLMFH